MNPEGVNLSDVWTDTSPNRHRRFKVRPGVNELKLIIPERAILISTEPGDLVLDPFGGGGSTYQAAEKHHRNWIGTELFDAAHIRRRIEEEFSFSAAQEPRFEISSLFNHEDKQDKVLRGIEREGVSARAGTHIS
jgi:site-specific DNA-methyltransferase (adenine-specific)